MSLGLGFVGAFNRGSCLVYSGSQPATADSAVTGTLLGTITVASGPLTVETQASQTITLSGASGSINSVLIGTTGAVNIIPDVASVPFDTDLATTAANLATAINRNGIYTATASAAVVTVRPRPGVGAAHNSVVLATTVTTMSATSGGNMVGGVSSINGLTFTAAAGVVSKSGTWSFAGVAAGTAGWFRMVGSVTDGGGSSTTLIRFDGSIATSGADMNLSNIAIAVAAPNTVDGFTFTIPAV